MHAPAVPSGGSPATRVTDAPSGSGRLRRLADQRPLAPQRGTDPYGPAPGPPASGAMGSDAAESNRGGDRPSSNAAGDAHAHRGRGRTALSGQPGSSLACAVGAVGHHRTPPR